MKRNIITVVTLLFLISPVFGYVRLVLDAPGDDYRIREAAFRGPAMRIFADKFNEIQKNRLWRLNLSEIRAVFGPNLHSLPAERVLPLFEGCGLGLQGPGRDEFHAIDKSHEDFYRVGDIGYLQLDYHRNGDSLQAVVLWFQPDADFVPLKSLDDLTRRLDWELKKFELFQKWLDQHLPK